MFDWLDVWKVLRVIEVIELDILHIINSCSSELLFLSRLILHFNKFVDLISIMNYDEPLEP